MAFMPVMIVGGQLLIAVADGVPQVNFEQTCRAAASEKLGLNDRFDDCVKAERIARELLAKQWGGFDAADRARCGRMATTAGASSYVELLTCLEMQKRAKSLHPPNEAAIIEPEPARERENLDPPVPAPPQVVPRQIEAGAPPAPRRAEAAAPPAPLAITPPPQQSNGPPGNAPLGNGPPGVLETICQSALQNILPACR